MKVLLFLMFPFLSCVVKAQESAITTDKMNILYAGVDNPLTIVSANCPCNKLVIKSSLGKIVSDGACKFLYTSPTHGSTEISVYKRNGKQLKKLNVYGFRVKKIPDPIFKIGPYGQSNSLSIMLPLVISSQEFVRAELENFDFDARFRVDSFRVSIYSSDTCDIKHFEVKSNRVPIEVRKVFHDLKSNDVIIFDKIYAVGPDGESRQLQPLVLTNWKDSTPKSD